MVQSNHFGETIFAFSLKIKHAFTIQLRNSTTTHLVTGNENIFPHKDLYMNVQSSIIQNSQNQKQSKYLSTGHCGGVERAEVRTPALPALH